MSTTNLQHKFQAKGCYSGFYPVSAEALKAEETCQYYNSDDNLNNWEAADIEHSSEKSYIFSFRARV